MQGRAKKSSMFEFPPLLLPWKVMHNTSAQIELSSLNLAFFAQPVIVESIKLSGALTSHIPSLIP